MAQDIKIKTRKQTERSYQVEFDDDWIKNSDDWHLSVYEITEIEPSSTIIDLAKLRIKLDDEKYDMLVNHLGATYCRFLAHNKLKIVLNDNEIKPVGYENWAYPPDFEPRHYSGIVHTK